MFLMLNTDVNDDYYVFYYPIVYFHLDSRTSHMPSEMTVPDVDTAPRHETHKARTPTGELRGTSHHIVSAITSNICWSTLSIMF